ncbi:DUF1294 domain-containing protein [Pontibacillus litoralis]|uniref:Membrane protein n=1 Tax=Pontibacillus litoralis JSM 072002 TaxID=1385512 RepID=A0A0A5G7G6_9BACI|nr:DUF1294 domain-containing protein [Pontibacillus litoralis]KGX89071.1 membrane protein [Pontibacillus litoralis JSM 072002]
MLIYVYAITINLLGFIVMGIDKRRARLSKWRIAEKHLWTIALLGGAFGNWAGMYVFRHKTKHRIFIVGTPIIVVLYFFLYFVITARLLS